MTEQLKLDRLRWIRSASWSDAQAMYLTDLAEARQQDSSALRAALERIERDGCDASEEEPRLWDRCLDYEYREDKPTGDPDVDRCNPCLAHAALGALPPSAPPALDVDVLTGIIHDATPPELDGGVPDVCNRYPEHEAIARAILARLAVEGK